MKNLQEYNKIRIDVIASLVEEKTTAIFEELLEDKKFKNLLKKELKTNKNIRNIAKTLSDYANKNLI